MSTIQMWSVQHPKLPTFYLHPNVQGILTPEHCARVARAVTHEAVIAADCTLIDISPNKETP